MAELDTDSERKKHSRLHKRDAVSSLLLAPDRKVAEALWLNKQDSLTRLDELQRLYEEAVRAREMVKHVSGSPPGPLRSANGSRRASASSELHDYRGRPLHDQLHGAYRATLLSHHTKNLNLKGFMNLFFILLFVINFRMVTDNLMEYGLMITFPSSFGDILSNWPILLCFLLMHFCILGAFVIERFVAAWVPQILDWSECVLIGINFFLVFIVPYLTVAHSSSAPASSALLLAFSVVWLFKLFSFHHVCLDTRRALRDGDNFHELCSNNEEAELVRKYPNSITLRHLYTFIWMPTMCFQFHYPRVPCIRWLSVIRHVFESAACLALMKIVIDQYIVPVAKNSFTITEMQSIPLSTLLVHFLDKVTKLSIPNLYVWLLMFVGLFHHWCNILAEITRFGDRQFYLDWWNASSFGEYWRKWNLPIHHFLNRHINKPLRRARFPKIVATSVVFLISALLHEYMITVPLQLGWTGWVFLGFMAQAPLTYITNLSFFQRNPTLGNCFFWFIFCFSGQPLGILIYWYLWGVKHGTVQQLDPSKIQIM
ncbi:acyl-CoA:diacylglycerol acyltransferase 1-related enzyme [Besnoitia besnoiti]|uniref:diacylglycerol O-acyltransferase n=1 Tax=Besnoitia besnoiti TaxID=94643 RepID=A0A2A9MQX2_BESBE|nr:acyl-CoA:diacylglycerol acyltransferase 1-related enzyme [Besnoitia besnoiti]PFH38542.1 acyl-CoA:diacylglycerol acyltransferase 1-related enzyme [Besnoitia besnoiti]